MARSPFMYVARRPAKSSSPKVTLATLAKRAVELHPKAPNRTVCALLSWAGSQITGGTKAFDKYVEGCVGISFDDMGKSGPEGLAILQALAAK